MGLPALSIPDSLLPRLRDVLSSTGLTVEQRVFLHAPIERDGLPPFDFVCSSPRGVTILARFAHAPDSAPHRLLLVLQPISKRWWMGLSETRLLRQIETALKQHGAMDLPHAQ